MMLLGAVTALCVLVYAGYRMVRHVAFAQHEAALPVFTSRCVGAPVTYPILSHPIVTFGDSITEGYGATNKCLPRELRAVLPESAHLLHTGDSSYPADLERLIRQPVLNYGVGGETTRAGLPRFRTIIRLVQPSTVIVLEGVNDLLHGYSVSGITTNLETMIQVVNAAHARCVVVTVLPLNGTRWSATRPRVTLLDAAIQSLGRRYGIRVVDASSAFAAHHPLSVLFRHVDGREDGLHPNDAGYRVLAQIVNPGLH